MYQILANYSAQAASAANADIPALTDQNFSTRNNHWIFSEDYQLQAVAGFGANLSTLQIFDPTWNSINVPQVYPINTTLNAPTNPQVMDLRAYPPRIPRNEEINVQGSNSDTMAASDAISLMFISPLGKRSQVPMPRTSISQFGRVLANFTVTAAITKGLWTADLNVTFTSQLKGGVYCWVGAYLINTAATAFRINFVRAPYYNGRKLTPGGLCEESRGLVPLDKGIDWLGPMGYFDTYEYPMMALLGNTTAGSATYSGFADLIYMSEGTISDNPTSYQDF